MVKKIIVSVLVGGLILSGCNQTKVMTTSSKVSDTVGEATQPVTLPTTQLTQTKTQTETQAVTQGVTQGVTQIVTQSTTFPISSQTGGSIGSSPDLKSLEGIREYLAGEWVFDGRLLYVSDVVCNLTIDEALNFQISFHDTHTDVIKGDYQGKIKLEKENTGPADVPDRLQIELTNSNELGGEFFYLHRTLYDGKYVMAWYTTGQQNSIFDLLSSDELVEMPSEIIFEKKTDVTSKATLRKNAEFYAVYWGKGDQGKSLWLDDVIWTPIEDEDVTPVYPPEMTAYQNDSYESVLYRIQPDQINEVMGDDLFPGSVYFVGTDKSGRIKEFISAGRKRFLEESAGNAALEIKEMIFAITKDIVEIQERLEAGMSLLIEEDTTLIEGKECYLIALGTNHEDKFTRELFYAVNLNTEAVYRYDVLTDSWEIVAVG